MRASRYGAQRLRFELTSLHAAVLLGRHKPGVSRTRRCFNTAGSVMSSGRASSLTDVSPDGQAREDRRRDASASAPKMASSSELRTPRNITNWLTIIGPTAALSRKKPVHSAVFVRFQDRPCIDVAVIRWCPFPRTGDNHTVHPFVEAMTVTSASLAAARTWS